MTRRVLSLWQPWASLCVEPDPDRLTYPAKCFETRHWSPRLPLPIPVVIHAAKKRDADVRAALDAEPFASTLARLGFGVAHPLPFGALVGVATVVRVRDTAAVEAQLRARGGACDLRELAFGDYTPGRYAWRLADAIALREPITFRGRQEPLYALPVEVAAQVDAQLSAIPAAIVP